jgi:hypothetical protein
LFIHSEIDGVGLRLQIQPRIDVSKTKSTYSLKIRLFSLAALLLFFENRERLNDEKFRPVIPNTVS